MNRTTYSILTLLVTLILIGALIAILYFIPGGVISMAGSQLYIVAGAAVAISLVLWGAIQFMGRSFFEAMGQTLPAAASAPRSTAISDKLAETKSELERTKSELATQKAKVAELSQPTGADAVQMLAILQRKGRLIDFLQEDLSDYQDAQIGAAVRTIQAESKSALAEYVTIEPIYTDKEGSSVAVNAGFDAHAIRLTGNVSGQPPFNGVIKHRGWRVTSIDLPKQTAGASTELIVASAEVEVG